MSFCSRSSGGLLLQAQLQTTTAVYTLFTANRDLEQVAQVK